VFVKDSEGRYLFLNRAAAQFVGQPAADILGKDDRVVLPPEDASVVMANDRLVMETGATQTSEEELCGRGRRQIILSTKAPHRDTDGNVIGVIGISRDVTGRIRREEELRLRDRAIQTVSQGIVITDATQADNP